MLLKGNNVVFTITKKHLVLTFLTKIGQE